MTKGIIQQIYKYRKLYILFLPCLVYLIIFNYIPMAGVILAFKDYTLTEGIWGSRFVGMENFMQLFKNGDFWKVTLNTLKISGLNLVIGFPAPIIIALMLNEVRNAAYKKCVQSVIFLPHFISWVVLSGIIITLLKVDGGFVNQIIINCGGKPIAFLSDNKYFVPTLIAANVWKGAGWGTIIYLAALSGMDADQHEAAIIDGANRWQRVIYITLPALVGAISINLIMQLSHILSAGFDQVVNLYSPLVYDTADIIDTYVYRTGLVNGKYEMATALGLFKSVVAFVLIVASNKVIKKLGGDGIW